MFEASPELPPAYEPIALPSHVDDVVSSSEEADDSTEDGTEDSTEDSAEDSAEESTEDSAEDSTEDDSVLESAESGSDEPWAEVVTPDFGAQPSNEDDEPTGEVARLDGALSEDHSQDDGPTEEAAEPVAAEQAPAEEAELEPVVPLTPVATAGAQEPAEGAAPPPVRLTIRRPLSATAAASALEGELAPGSSEPLETPIFGQLRSNWLNDEPERPWTANEVERGWETAVEAETGDPEGRTRTGLPVRRPGGRLVPGGVAPETAAVTRDPEAIRNRLAAHSAGVSRGRAAAAAQPLTDDYAHEETGPA
jgi:hypothetical protein